MSDIKCPFCQQELKDQWVGQNVAHEYFDCPKCKMNGNPKLWQELIRTRKALDVALDEINKIKVAAESVGIGFFMTAAIFASAKIKTALEQKDK